MDIVTKAVAATISDTSASSGEFPGTFLVELSNESLDRDGDTLKADEWETPLPQQITFVNDHTHKMASVVGSATPELVDGKIMCRGTWAETDNAQDTRKVIKHVPYVSVAYREKHNRKAGTVSRELINGSFVVVPSNPNAKVLASKSADAGDVELRVLLKSAVEEAVTDAVDKMRSLLSVGQSGSVLPQGFTAEVDMADDLTICARTLRIKDANGNVLLAHKFSTAPSGAPPNGADPEADLSKNNAAALDQLKAAADQIITHATF